MVPSVVNRHLIRWPSGELHRARYCAIFRQIFLAVAFLCLSYQVVYDRHLITAATIFPQWLVLGAIWYSWNGKGKSDIAWRHGLPALAFLIPASALFALMAAWLGWKANTLAICGVIPVSDSASYYVSAQTFLREAILDPSGQRRPLNTILTSIWLYFSADSFKVSILVQVLAFSAAAFLGAAVTTAIHGFRAGLLLFAFLLMFAEPYLPTMLSENNGIVFGILALVGFLFGLNRGSFLAYCFGAFALAMGLAIRPSALFVLPCVVIAGPLMFGTTRIGRVAVVAALIGAILLPSATSVSLNKTMSHSEGALNSNLSYTVYGLVAGGKGWEQYQKDHPRTLDGLGEAERSRIILKASRQHFMEHPVDLVRALVVGQVAGPLQTFAQIVRLAFFGAAADPARIVSPAAILLMSLLFAGVLLCHWASGGRVGSDTSRFRPFCLLFLLGYLISLPFFYKDGGLRLQAAVLPVLSYMLVRILVPPSALSGKTSDDIAARVYGGTVALGFILLGLIAWMSLAHPKSRNFDPIPVSGSRERNNMIFWFKQGWPQCDMLHFPYSRADGRPRIFSGAIPDDNYRSAGLEEISGRGSLYFGFDAGAREWLIIHTDEHVGMINAVELRPNGPDKYRDFISTDSVREIDAAPGR
jgi:hypothetical protein